jgi:cysteine-rich repeat protein
VAGQGAGNFLAVWQDSIGNDILAQRFSGACGNGAVDAGEACDDGNTTSGDGCEANCVVQTCSTCSGAPSSCAPIVTCVGGDGCCAPGCTHADDPDCPVLATGAMLFIRDPDAGAALRTIVFKSKDPGIDTTVGSGIDPVADGAFLHVFNAGGGAGTSKCFALRSEGTALWKTLKPTATGEVFAYTDNDRAVGPCKLARVKDGSLLRVRCFDHAFLYDLHSPEGSIAVRFASGSAEYCSVFGGVRRDEFATFLGVNAPAPASCPTPSRPCPEIIPLGP